MTLVRIIHFLEKHPAGQFILGVLLAYTNINAFVMLFSPNPPSEPIVGWIVGVFCLLAALIFFASGFARTMRWLHAKSAPAETQQPPSQSP